MVEMQSLYAIHRNNKLSHRPYHHLKSEFLIMLYFHFVVIKTVSSFINSKINSTYLKISCLWLLLSLFGMFIRTKEKTQHQPCGLVVKEAGSHMTNHGLNPSPGGLRGWAHVHVSPTSREDREKESSMTTPHEGGASPSLFPSPSLSRLLIPNGN